jgi:hypothetical protein
VEKTDNYRKGHGSGKKWDGGPGGGGGRGPYGGGGGGGGGSRGPRTLSDIRSNDHSMYSFLDYLTPLTTVNICFKPLMLISGSLPACGSCCG